MNLRGHPKEQPEVNLTSLIDVVLLLLILMFSALSGGGGGRTKAKKEKETEKERDRLYQQIGKLQVEVDWLRKKTGHLD